MLSAIQHRIGKSAIITLDPKKAKEFLDPGHEGSFNGTVISADVVGILTRGFLSVYEEECYYRDVRDLVDNEASAEQKADLLKFYTDLVVIPWHVIIGITFVD